MRKSSPAVVLIAAFAALILGVSGLVAVGWVVAYELTHVRTSNGTCLRFAPRHCTNLTPDYLTDLSGLAIDKSSEVVESSANPSLDYWGFGATVLLPSGASAPLFGEDVTDSPNIEQYRGIPYAEEIRALRESGYSDFRYTIEDRKVNGYKVRIVQATHPDGRLWLDIRGYGPPPTA